MQQGLVAERLPFGTRGAVVARLGARDKLARELRCPADGTDAAVVRAAWDRWGEQTPNQMRGPFGFAVTDARSVWLVRDPLGEVPLYFSRVPGGVVVGSDVASVLADPEVSDEVDMDAVALRLARCFRECARRTDFRAVSKVAPGTMVRIEADGTREFRYWRPETIGTNSRLRFEDAVDQAQELLRTAVQDRLHVDRTAVHLSGGLDSGVVAALAAEQLRDCGGVAPPATTWSPAPSDAGYGDPDRDERHLVATLGTALGLEPIYAETPRVLAAVSRPAYLLDDPPAAWLVEQTHAEVLSAAGVSTVLTGWGGDEALSMHSRLVPGELLRGAKPGLAWRATQAPPGVTRTLRGRARYLASATCRSAGVGVATVDGVGSAADVAWRRYSPEIADARLDQQRQWNAGTSTRELMLNRLQLGHLAARNEAWAHGGHPIGLAYLHPLQDRAVVEFALTLPPQFFTYAGTHRRIFRAIAAGLLPAAVVAAPKVVGSDPARTQLTRQAVVTRLPLLRQAGEHVGWPPALLDAWLGSLERVWYTPRTTS
ncbi:MAG: hypothetical protein QG597_4601 [Actinomycetota bacterium]|nr:hypothetical protein [Actinomycetota bacterium]